MGPVRQWLAVAGDLLGMTGLPCRIAGHDPWRLVNPHGRVVGTICRRCGDDL